MLIVKGIATLFGRWEVSFRFCVCFSTEPGSVCVCVSAPVKQLRERTSVCGSNKAQIYVSYVVFVCVWMWSIGMSPLMVQFKWVPGVSGLLGLTLSPPVMGSQTQTHRQRQKRLLSVKNSKPELAKAMALRVTNSSFSSFIVRYFLTSWRMALFRSRSPASFDWSSSIM